MAFNGFGPPTFDFLRELAANNTRDWFEQHRDRYERDYKGAALDFIDALAPGLAALRPALKAEARINGSLRRVNRDVRFSSDKSPYKARIHLIFWTGAHPNRSPAMHLVLHPESIGYGAGVFGLDPAALARYRARILDPADRASLAGAEQSAASVGCTWGEPELRTMPRGISADGDWTHLLRRKSFVMRTRSEQGLPGWIAGPEAVDGVMALTRACLPLIGWLAGAGLRPQVP